MARAQGFGSAIRDLKDLERSMQAVAKLKDFQGSAKMKVKLDIKGLDDLPGFTKYVKGLPAKILLAHHKTMESIAPRLKEALDDAMSSSVWQWTEGTRDIIDTGALKESGKVAYSRTSLNISIAYGEEYAAIVHYGGYVKSGYNSEVQIYYPARPWIQSVLTGGNGITAFPFAAIYKAEFFNFLKT
jgi:phage gpG-like protein